MSSRAPVSPAAVAGRRSPDPAVIVDDMLRDLHTAHFRSADEFDRRADASLASLATYMACHFPAYTPDYPAIKARIAQCRCELLFFLSRAEAVVDGLMCDDAPAPAGPWRNVSPTIADVHVRPPQPRPPPPSA